ncbi:MAG: 6-pyruvoyl trahydropterin synthase family protein [Pirellulaceae bacterium]
MASQRFEVVLEKQTLIFSAAHFITFGDNVCESIHGHNYRVACRIGGQLDSLHAYVIDFIWLRDALHRITQTLDHKVLLPDRHPSIEVRQDNNEFEVTFEERRWVFPSQDVMLLPVDNTTAERLAEYIAGELLEQLDQIEGLQPEKVAVGVDENEGQWAWCELLVQ